MHDREAYFKSPIFESSKSSRVVRYRNKFELCVMKNFDAEFAIKSYFQPLMMGSVRHNNQEESITVDFWVEYFKELTDLVHLDPDNKFPLNLQSQIFSMNREISRLNEFGFIVIGKNRLRRVPAEYIRLTTEGFKSELCYYNFKWIN